MDLSAVCEPASKDSPIIADDTEPKTRSPLPSLHELEYIRVSLSAEEAAAAAEAAKNKDDNRHSSSPRAATGRPPQKQSDDTSSTGQTVSSRIPELIDEENEKIKNSKQQQQPGILEKYRNELRDVAEKCKILSQFADLYGPEKNKFNAQPSDDLVIDMARKSYEVLMVFMTIRRERMASSADDDTMEYIRKRRTVLSPTRAKVRKRSKRSDAAQPNACRSCGISETPEWRRGPDGARTLCNACGLHYAKLSKKRATDAAIAAAAATGVVTAPAFPQRRSKCAGGGGGSPSSPLEVNTTSASPVRPMSAVPYPQQQSNCLPAHPQTAPVLCTAVNAFRQQPSMPMPPPPPPPHPTTEEPHQWSNGQPQPRHYLQSARIPQQPHFQYAPYTDNNSNNNNGHSYVRHSTATAAVTNGTVAVSSHHHHPNGYLPNNFQQQQQHYQQNQQRSNSSSISRILG